MVISDSDEESFASKQAKPKQTTRLSRATREPKATSSRVATSSTISQAFARQSQISSQTTQRVAPPTPAAASAVSSARSKTQPKSSSSRGICYISDSD